MKLTLYIKVVDASRGGWMGSGELYYYTIEDASFIPHEEGIDEQEG